MHYILLTELVNTGISSCIIMGLPPPELAVLEKVVTDLQLPYTRQEHFFEVDTQGVTMLNMLSDRFHYRVAGQSMVIEKSNVGGRTVQIQKINWTLAKEQ